MNTQEVTTARKEVKEEATERLNQNLAICGLHSEEDVINKYNPLLDALAMRHAGGDRDRYDSYCDYKSEGVINGIMYALRHYDPDLSFLDDKKHSLHMYIVQCVKNAMISYSLGNNSIHISKLYMEAIVYLNKIYDLLEHNGITGSDADKVALHWPTDNDKIYESDIQEIKSRKEHMAILATNVAKIPLPREEAYEQFVYDNSLNLYLETINYCLDHFNYKSTDVRALDAIDSQYKNPEELYMEKEYAEKVYAIAESMGEESAIIWKSKMEGYTLEEIGEMCRENGITKEAVRQRIRTIVRTAEKKIGGANERR
jgi:RNA polymerase sigma factor (sigma-70 family)